MSMLEAARSTWTEWRKGHGHDDVPQMSPSFWKGFKAGVAWSESQYGLATEEPEEEA